MDKYYFLQETNGHFLVICKSEVAESTEVTIRFSEINKKSRYKLAKFTT